MNRRQFVEASGGLSLGLVLATGVFRRAANAQMIYSSLDLGLPEGYDSVVPIALNENGVVVVAAAKGATHAIFTVTDGVFTQVGREGSMAQAACIDRDGNVGGWIEVSSESASTPTAGGTPAVAGTPAAASSVREVPVILTEGNQSEMPGEPVEGRVLGLQQGGTAVGEAALDSHDARKAVIWAHQEVQELSGTPNGGSSAARDINALGQIAGWIESGDGAAVSRTAVLFDVEGDPVEIGGLDGAQSEAVAISEQGQVAGNFIPAGADGRLGGDGAASFLWTNSALTPLLALDGQRWSMAADLNTFGLVAGTVGLSAPGPTGAPTTAVVWGSDSVFDLNQFAQPVDGVTLTTAVGINEFGQVLCGGIDANGHSHAVLLSTVGN